MISIGYADILEARPTDVPLTERDGTPRRTMVLGMLVAPAAGIDLRQAAGHDQVLMRRQVRLRSPTLTSPARKHFRDLQGASLHAEGDFNARASTSRRG